MKTIRFWTYYNDTFVRLSLQDGQEICFGSSRSTEEGWESSFEVYRRDGLTIHCTLDSQALDCDGRLDRYWEGQAHWPEDFYIGTIDAGQWDKDIDSGVPTGYRVHWQTVDRYQVDHEAIKAGY